MTSVPTVRRLTAHAPRGTDFVATATPALSWRTETGADNWRQLNAEIEFHLAGQVQHAEVASSASVQVAWPFAPLAPGADGELRVRVTGADGITSDWSEPLRVRAGFLAVDAWQAAAIGLPAPTHDAQPGLVRTDFVVEGEISSAVLYATAVGVYQVEINGTDVDDQVMKPGWTPYQYRLIHETTDVTSLINNGANAIGVRFAGAWATEHFGFRKNANRCYVDQPAVAVQLEITFTDGRTMQVLSDGSWRASTGPITASGLYNGEDFDARLIQAGWSATDFDDSSWQQALITTSMINNTPLVTPEPRNSPPVRRISERSVESVIMSPSGATLLDFGQNLVGWLKINVTGPAGTKIILRHAEVLEHGELGVRPLRAAKATDTYILGGQGEETWEPDFTFHGFRYAEITGWPGEFDPAAVTAVVIHSDMERTGWFDSSHAQVNQLHENIVWGQKGNFFYVPTDCPQRDERLGWTGDIQVFAPTASFLFDVSDFLSSWMIDLAVEQEQAHGVVPFIIPSVLGAPRPAAAWGDAATIVPTVLHERYADLDTVRRQFASMKAWTDVLLEVSGERHLWEGRFQFGDWLDPTAPPEFPAEAKAHPDLVASAHVFRSADFTARAAELLGDEAAATFYSAQAEAVRQAFVAEYVTPAGRLMSDAQTAYSLAIVFDIVPAEQQQALGDRLAALVRENGYRIGTGFVGTPIICDALTQTGHIDAAVRLLTQTENPSWLYPVTMGATTIWERWDSMLPDGSINPGQMTSFNHYAFGAIGDWLHRTLAGLAPAAPGYAQIHIEPRPVAGFDYAEASHLTPYGLATSRWERSGDLVTVTAVIPANTGATVVLPDGASHEIGSGQHSWTVTAPVAVDQPGRLSLQTGLAQLIDDADGYRAVLTVLADLQPEQLGPIRDHTTWVPSRSIGELLSNRSGRDVWQAVTEAFDVINQSRGLDLA